MEQPEGTQSVMRGANPRPHILRLHVSINPELVSLGRKLNIAARDPFFQRRVRPETLKSRSGHYAAKLGLGWFNSRSRA